MKKEPNFVWKSQKMAGDCETIDCPEYDLYKSFKMEPTGFYVLIGLNFADYRIEVGICHNRDHKVEKIFSGRKAQDIYTAIFNYEKSHKLSWFTEKNHIAYLGKELKKAEIALAMGNSAYFQE